MYVAFLVFVVFQKETTSITPKSLKSRMTRWFRKPTYPLSMCAAYNYTTRIRADLWPDARCIHRERTTNMVLKINSIFQDGG